MKTQLTTGLLLLSTAMLVPLAAATPETSVIIDDVGTKYGGVSYPLCVWWNIPPRTVNTPGASVNRPPVHVTVDPTSTYIPGSYGEICLYSLLDAIAVTGDVDADRVYAPVALP